MENELRTFPDRPVTTRRLMEIEHLAFRLLRRELAACVVSSGPMGEEARGLVVYFERHGVGRGSLDPKTGEAGTARVAFFESILGGLSHELRPRLRRTEEE